MGSVLFKVSDLSGEIVQDETQLTRLVIESHPDYDEPITLEVLPEEVEGELPEAQEFVAFSYYFPGDPEPHQYLLPVDQFNALFKVGVDDVLERVLATQQENKGRRGRRSQPAAERKPRIDYASSEHAGEPHRGTISEAERLYVREHLDEVNARLREQGKREIDPSDLTMIERYGLTPPEL